MALKTGRGAEAPPFLVMDVISAANARCCGQQNPGARHHAPCAEQIIHAEGAGYRIAFPIQRNQRGPSPSPGTGISRRNLPGHRGLKRARHTR